MSTASWSRTARIALAFSRHRSISLAAWAWAPARSLRPRSTYLRLRASRWNGIRARSWPRRCCLHGYDMDDSPARQVFQNFVLGAEQYLRYYGLPPRITSKGLLEALDRPLLRPDLCRALLGGRFASALFPVIFTARPSLTPVEVRG